MSLILPQHNRLSLWFHNPWPPAFSGCCCKSAPSSPAPNCFSKCCATMPPSTLHLTIGSQTIAGHGCSGGTPVTGFDGKIVALTFDNQTSCHWKGDLICGTGGPPAGSCGGGASGCDGTNHFNVFCCPNPPCVSLLVALTVTAGYAINGNSLTVNGTTVHYFTSVVLTGSCSPMNMTGTLTTLGSAPGVFCDTCTGGLGCSWPVTLSS